MLPRIQISRRNPHLLETADGRQFLFIADTAWELFHRTYLDEAREYLSTRAEQRFNMIWANVLAEFDGIRTPNVYGNRPFVDEDPLQPNEGYFEYVDNVIGLATERGLYVGLLPTWGDKLTSPWGDGPALFRMDNLNVAYEYAKWLGSRYAFHDNVLWVLGGDRPAKLFGPENEFPRAYAKHVGLPMEVDWTPIWRALAHGLRAGGAQQLITYHPQGGSVSSSVFLHNEPWLQINAIQSGHGDGHDAPNWDLIARDYAMQPTKPTFEAEPNYEDHPVSPWPKWDPQNGRFDDYDVRKQLYRSIFAGGCGVVYGHHSIWQFASDRYPGINHVLMGWKTALHRPGAEQVRHLRTLTDDFDLLASTPAPSLLSPEPSPSKHACALRSPNRWMIYFPVAAEAILPLEQFSGRPFRLERFDPVSGLIGDWNAPLSTERDAVAVLTLLD
ncbi:MAG TPA: DUF4038 domain-containing protein [Fimbriimonas sp.]|nr:DUF4038 domain-containing protein [Fimbriimonas sp.]